MDFWFDHGNKGISIIFDKDLVKYGIKKHKKENCVKGVDSIYQKSISIFGVIFTYGDFNYNKIIHILLNHQKDNYTNSKDNHSISVLKETLLNYHKNKFKDVSTPFNWNTSYNKDTGEIIYYITGEKKWFEENHLQDLVNGCTEIVGRENIIKNLNRFPKYNIHRTNKVICYIDDENKKEA